jgi:penicillin amidase
MLMGSGPLAAQWLDSARARLAQIDGRLAVPGLDSAVEVRRDRWGVPHIYARTRHDLFFAQGFVVGQDRLWQVDMWRRQGEGRLSEVLGGDYLERDRMARLLRYRGNLQAEWASYGPDTRAIVGAFIAGLNAYARIARARPPIEYTILGFLPEPFSEGTPLQRVTAFSMTGNADDEIRRARLVALVGPAQAEALWPLDPPRRLDPAPGLDYALIPPDVLGALGDVAGRIRYPAREGSNNWVVSGALTASGKPILANDPHRALSVPSLRYVSHLVGPGWNVIGAGEPGLPGVAAGHNDRIAFGFTIVGMDQQDVFVTEVRRCPTPPRVRRCYRADRTWKPIRVVVDTIRVKGQAPVVVRHQYTQHGPIISEDGFGSAFVLRFVGSEPGTAGYLAQVALNQATDWAGFLNAAARWKLPSENLVFADVDGNIGWVAAGLMPMRSWSGLLPVFGDGRYEWKGFLPFAELPQSFNPESGFIATANHNILPAGYARLLSYEWADPFRANRIAGVLKSRKGWTRADFERLQHDELSAPAQELVPKLLAAADRLRTAGPAFETLRRWDFVMRRDQAAPVLFHAWLDSLARRVFRPRAGAGAQVLAGAGFSLPLLLRLVAQPDSLFGPAPEAARDTVLVRSFESSTAGLVRELGPNLPTWRWESLHRAAFDHPLGADLNLHDASRGGDRTTVNATSGPGFRQTSGASYRQILDLADWDNSVATSVPGQSGQPGSPYYGNLLPLWEKGEYFPLVFSRQGVERETAHVLWLDPPGRRE